MPFKAFIFNIAIKHQKIIEAMIIFLIFLGVSFKIGGGEVQWAWNSYPFLAILIIILAILLMLLWLRIDKKKLEETRLSINDNIDTSEKMDLLSNKQQQVYHLIIANKSNKEICKELFIEMSTLKTHINNIYRILEVKTRKEFKIKHKKQ